MSSLRHLAAIVLSFALIFQISAQASAMQQSDEMSIMDCEKMKHHASQEMERAGHADGSDGSCEDMSLACMLSMNTISPVLLGIEATPLVSKLIADGLLHSPEGEEQLTSRTPTPDYPPPRL